ncbi:hypothetical protein F1643_21005 [Azospirillum sp. INR13]|uniref:hypothetical protein n=1 Tax=Azospirillum sp. INR13 TaxID=2596919 RepID=UPI001891FD08|nr:hypothetical protein [Azospirillum sp. INR13]MBF5096479.1 hypothetical protein [Azospirillum sp. INR13]
MPLRINAALEPWPTSEVVRLVKPDYARLPAAAYQYEPARLTARQAVFRATNLDEDSIAKLLVEATAARPIVTARPRSAHEALRIHALAIAHCKKYGGTWILDEALRVSTPFLSEAAD